MWIRDFLCGKSNPELEEFQYCLPELKKLEEIRNKNLYGGFPNPSRSLQCLCVQSGLHPYSMRLLNVPPGLDLSLWKNPPRVDCTEYLDFIHAVVWIGMKGHSRTSPVIISSSLFLDRYSSRKRNLDMETFAVNRVLDRMASVTTPCLMMMNASIIDCTGSHSISYHCLQGILHH